MKEVERRESEALLVSRMASESPADSDSTKDAPHAAAPSSVGTSSASSSVVSQAADLAPTVKSTAGAATLLGMPGLFSPTGAGGEGNPGAGNGARSSERGASPRDEELDLGAVDDVTRLHGQRAFLRTLGLGAGGAFVMGLAVVGLVRMSSPEGGAADNTPPASATVAPPHGPAASPTGPGSTGIVVAPSTASAPRQPGHEEAPPEGLPAAGDERVALPQAAPDGNSVAGGPIFGDDARELEAATPERIADLPSRDAIRTRVPISRGATDLARAGDPHRPRGLVEAGAVVPRKSLEPRADGSRAGEAGIATASLAGTSTPLRQEGTLSPPPMSPAQLAPPRPLPGGVARPLPPPAPAEDPDAPLPLTEE